MYSMICTSCGNKTYRSYTYWKDHKMIKDVCGDCYPMGRVNSILNNPKNKIKSRTLMSDGTVLTGQAGIKARDKQKRK